MKKAVFLFLISSILISCSGQNKPENKPAAANQTANNPAKPANNSNGPVNSSGAGQNQPGERVEQPAEVSFGPDGFPPGWRWIDPDNKNSPTKYDTKSGVLHIDVPTDKDLYGENRTAPQLLKAVTGDFEIETRVRFDPQEDYQGAGLLVFRNASNYIRLERGFGGTGGGLSGVRFDKREDEIFEPVATQENFPTDAKTVELKMRRKGREFTAFWRVAGGEWQEVGKYLSSYPETVQVGLIACNTGREIAVEFEYVKLAPLK